MVSFLVKFQECQNKDAALHLDQLNQRSAKQSVKSYKIVPRHQIFSNELQLISYLNPLLGRPTFGLFWKMT